MMITDADAASPSGADATWQWVSNGQAAKLVWAVAGLAAALLVFLTALGEARPPGWELCLTNRFLGLPCPGCGLTRGVTELFRGNLSQALALHPLAPLAVADVAGGWVLWGLALHGVARPPARAVWMVLLAQLALFLALWLGRLASGTAPL